MSVKLSILSMGDKLERLASNLKDTRAVLVNVAYPMYQKAQVARWKSGGDGSKSVNTSEGDAWPALNPKYLRRKRIKYSGFDYSGNQMLVATGDLLKSVVVPNRRQGFNWIEFYTTVPYAKYVNRVRSFNKFSGETRSSIIKAMGRAMRYG